MYKIVKNFIEEREKDLPPVLMGERELTQFIGSLDDACKDVFLLKVYNNWGTKEYGEAFLYWERDTWGWVITSSLTEFDGGNPMHKENRIRNQVLTGSNSRHVWRLPSALPYAFKVEIIGTVEVEKVIPDDDFHFTIEWSDDMGLRITLDEQTKSIIPPIKEEIYGRSDKWDCDYSVWEKPEEIALPDGIIDKVGGSLIRNIGVLRAKSPIMVKIGKLEAQQIGEGLKDILKLFNYK